MHGDAVTRRQQMDGLKIFRLREPHRLLVEQESRGAERAAKPRIIFHGADAAVDVDRGVDFGVAGIRDRDRFIFRAIGDQHVGDRADQLGALGKGQRTQGRPAALARMIERGFQIEAARARGRQHIAMHRIDQFGLDTFAAPPRAREVALQYFAHDLSPFPANGAPSCILTGCVPDPRAGFRCQKIG